jgi:hypothetical protein
MIPHTFPSVLEALQTKMVVYVLPSIAGKTAWIDYIPIKGVLTENNALANTYANDGFIVVKKLTSATGLQEWLNYIPVYEDAAYNKPWSTDAGGYIPTNRDELRENLENEDGFNLLLEDGFYLLQEF